MGRMPSCMGCKSLRDTAEAVDTSAATSPNRSRRCRRCRGLGGEAFVILCCILEKRCGLVDVAWEGIHAMAESASKHSHDVSVP